MAQDSLPRIQTAIRSLALSALDLLLPFNCVGCGREGQVICAVCIGSLKHLEAPFCDTCDQPGVQGKCSWCQENPSSINGIRAPYLFEGPLREAVHRLKYRGWSAAAPVLGGLLADYLVRNPLPVEVLVPVPLHSRRLRSRGYNQSNLLAKEVGKLLEIPVQEEFLVRTKNSLPQVDTQSRDDRRNNVADSFISPVAVAGKSVLVVDDVSTTGSTLLACSDALNDAGATSVWGLVLGRES